MRQRLTPEAVHGRVVDGVLGHTLVARLGVFMALSYLMSLLMPVVWS